MHPKNSTLVQIFLDENGTLGLFLAPMLHSLRFSDALEAIRGGSADQLRVWLKRGHAKLEGGFGGAWATFTLTDIATLALMRVLAVDFNVEPAEAFKIAQALVKHQRQPRFKGEGEELWRGWENRWCAIVRKDGRWSFVIYSDTNELFGNFIRLDPGMIIRPAVESAIRIANDRAAERLRA